MFCVKSVILQRKGEKLTVTQGRFWRGILPYLIYQTQLLFAINVPTYATKKEKLQVHPQSKVMSQVLKMSIIRTRR